MHEKTKFLNEMLTALNYRDEKEAARKTSGADPDSLLLQQESLSRIWDSKSEDLYEL